jgi:hypothetical protein
MHERLLLGSAEAVNQLADRFSQIPYIAGQSSPHDDAPPSWTLANSLADIEGECRRLLDENLPRLVRATSSAELGSVLGEIRIGLQHIVYHLATTPELRSLIDNAPPLHEVA